MSPRKSLHMKTLLLSLLINLFYGCEKKNTGLSIPNADSSIPICIQDKIKDLKNKPRFNPPASITQYTYNEQIVYYITSDCCDQYNQLFDSNCNLICSPDGGITGGGDRKCTDFKNKKTNEKLIWKDPR